MACFRKRQEVSLNLFFKTHITYRQLKGVKPEANSQRLPFWNGLFSLACVNALELLQNYSLSLVSPPQTLVIVCVLDVSFL